MGPPSYMRSVVDRNVVMRRMTVFMMWDLRFGDGGYSRRTVADVPAELNIDPEEGDNVLLRNVSVLFHEYTTSRPRTSYPCRSKNLHFVGAFALLNKRRLASSRLSLSLFIRLPILLSVRMKQCGSFGQIFVKFFPNCYTHIYQEHSA